MFCDCDDDGDDDKGDPQRLYLRSPRPWAVVHRNATSDDAHHSDDEWGVGIAEYVQLEIDGTNKKNRYLVKDLDVRHMSD